MFKKLIMKLTARSRYVIADANDNSITFSKRIYKDLDLEKMDKCKVFTFRVGDEYAFIINPELDQDTQLADVQYNPKYKSVGYECLVPTVNRIFYDYGLPVGTRCKLSVVVETGFNMTYYRIQKPKRK